MSMSKADLLREFDKFVKDFRQHLIESGASHLSKDVVATAVEILIERGIWEEKNRATFERMGGDGKSLTTLTTGNKEAETVIEELMAEPVPEPEPDKPKRGRPPKDKTEKADA